MPSAAGRGWVHVEGTADAQTAAVQHVRVDHRRPDVLVAQLLLDRTRVVPGLQQARREAVPERVARHPRGNLGGARGIRYREAFGSPGLGVCHQLIERRTPAVVESHLLVLRACFGITMSGHRHVARTGPVRFQ